jgi:hypothetical protein
MDGISIAGLVLGIGSGLVLFIKGVRKCKCTKRGISLERESNNELGRQQEFTLKLVELLHTYPKEFPDVPGGSASGLSEISEEITPEIKDKMSKMLEILNNVNDQRTNPHKRTKTLKAVLGSSKKEQMRKQIRKEVEQEIQEKIELELHKKKKEKEKAAKEAAKDKKITQFITAKK